MWAGRKWLKRGLGLAGSGVIVTGASYPVWQGILDHTGDPQNIPAGIVYRGTGYDYNSGNFNVAALKDYAIILAGTFVVGKVLKYAAKLV